MTTPRPIGQTIREWAPVAVTLLGFVVWLVTGQQTAQVVSRDLQALTAASQRERDRLSVELGGLTTEVRRLSEATAEARAERKGLHDAVQRIESRCCGGR